MTVTILDPFFIVLATSTAAHTLAPDEMPQKGASCPNRSYPAVDGSVHLIQDLSPRMLPVSSRVINIAQLVSPPIGRVALLQVVALFHSNGHKGGGSFYTLQLIGIFHVLIQVDRRHIGAIESGNSDSIGRIVSARKLRGQKIWTL